MVWASRTRSAAPSTDVATSVLQPDADNPKMSRYLQTLSDTTLDSCRSTSWPNEDFAIGTVGAPLHAVSRTLRSDNRAPRRRHFIASLINVHGCCCEAGSRKEPVNTVPCSAVVAQGTCTRTIFAGHCWRQSARPVATNDPINLHGRRQGFGAGAGPGPATSAGAGSPEAAGSDA